ncbi:MAG: penicillin-binding protein 2 [Candidatus Omnitrophica bacterium]|nr:penicillin-binding protein 2 [Candidatus Omnitrophota bacterium]
MRIKIFRLIIFICFCILAGELAYMQAVRGPYYFNLSKNNRIRVVSLESERGRIMDRNGKILADNQKIFNVMVIPQEIQNEEKLFAFLSEQLEENSEVLLRRYRQRKLTPFTPVLISDDISKVKALQIEENRYQFPSILVQENYRRYYPYGRAGAHILGYVGKIDKEEALSIKDQEYTLQSVIGKIGVEKFYNDRLMGQRGGVQIEVNSRGEQVRLLGLKDPVAGEDLTLTVDQEIQLIATDLLTAKAGVIIVMDMKNGEVLGMTSSPDFDPNILISGKSQRDVNYLFNNKSSPMLDRATRGVFPPGSVFKIPVALCGLNSQKISQHTTYNCEGFYELGGIKFGCTHHHGPQNLIQSIAHSCNVYYYHLGLKLGSDLISQFVGQLGFGKITGIDLPYEKEGNIPSRRKSALSGKKWFTGNSLNMAIGQGDVLVTPLQLVGMMAIVAREGIVVQPHLIKDINQTYVFDFPQRKLKMDSEIFKIVKQGLRATVTDAAGTARELHLNEVYVAGKTGTAQTSGSLDHHAWFVGYALGERKEVAFCVFLEHGGSSHNANQVARELLLKMYEKKLL